MAKPSGRWQHVKESWQIRVEYVGLKRLPKLGKDTGAVSVWRGRLTSIGIPMLKIRRSRDRIIFNIKISIPGKYGLYIETGCVCYVDYHSIYQKQFFTLPQAGVLIVTLANPLPVYCSFTCHSAAISNLPKSRLWSNIRSCHYCQSSFVANFSYSILVILPYSL